MNRDEIMKLIIEILKQIQQLSGREIPDISEDTIPIGGLSGFDSQNGLELTVMLPEEIQWPGNNLCVSDDGTQALSVREITDRLISKVNPSE